jgi:hypothetical protein
MDDKYKHKYYKYKTKYLELKKIIGGDIRKQDFPYKKELMKEVDILSKFNNLSKYEPVLEHQPYRVYNITFLNKYEFLYKGKHTLLVKKSSDYEDYNILSDYFQEFCRMKCKRYDQEMSPYDYWVNNLDKVIQYSKDKYNKTDPHSLRESIYHLIGECTSFRPTVMVSIIKMFNSKVILDFSAGWGDRLIGALACDNIINFYCGVDPNTCVHPNYQKMIKFFNKNIKKYNMIESPFQTAEVPKRDYDLIMTSPPYFNLEKYTDEDTQSISSSADLEDWLKDFLFISLSKSWNLLIPDGHLVVSINDMRDTPGVQTYKFVEKMINYVNTKLINSKYLGVISYAEKRDNGRFRSPQPLWIWKKSI